VFVAIFLISNIRFAAVWTLLPWASELRLRHQYTFECSSCEQCVGALVDWSWNFAAKFVSVTWLYLIKMKTESRSPEGYGSYRRRLTSRDCAATVTLFSFLRFQDGIIPRIGLDGMLFLADSFMLKGNLNCSLSVTFRASRSYCRYRRQTALSIYGEHRVSTLDFHFTGLNNSRLCLSCDRSFHSYYEFRNAPMSVGNVDSSFRYWRCLTRFCWLVVRGVTLLLVFTTVVLGVVSVCPISVAFGPSRWCPCTSLRRQSDC
jgi:hypothetical protein